jgi:hypothetical protein
MKFRCILFGRFVRESRDRILDAAEIDFMNRHRNDCTDCRAREVMTQYALDTLVETSKGEPEIDLSSQKVADILRQIGLNNS